MSEETLKTFIFSCYIWRCYLSVTRIMYENNKVVLYKTQLKEFAKDLFTTRVGIRSLAKLGLAVGYERAGNGLFRCVYYLIHMTPTMKRLQKEQISTNKKGILKVLCKTRKWKTGRAFDRIVLLEAILYLQKITVDRKLPNKRCLFEFVGCSLLKDGEIVDTFMAKANGHDAYRMLSAFEGVQNGKESYITDFLCAVPS